MKTALKIVDQDFKAQLESITPADIMALRAIKADKTLSQHLDRIKAGRFEKREINALTKLYAGVRFSENEARKQNIQALKDLTMTNQDCISISSYGGHCYGEIYHFNRPAKITKEQTEQGKAYLKNHYFKQNGQPRTGKNTESVSDRVLAIASKVKRFEFIGLLFVSNSYGTCNQVLPIYRTFNAKGEYYDYAPIHWGQPVIMEGY